MPDAPASRKLKFIGCEIIYREACYLAAISRNRVDVEFLRKGLHDLETQDMRAKVQATIDAVDRSLGYEAILLGYARCNDGLAGIVARDIPLVIPRAHDCITFFFGSRSAYMDHFQQNPGTYYLTTGWSERNVGLESAQPAYGQQGVMGKLGLAQSYEQLVAQYGEDNAKYIAELTSGWEHHYTRCLYIEMGVGDEKPFVERARQVAQERQWQFDHRNGEWKLLKKLFEGEWDEDFLVVPPGRSIVPRNDGAILDLG